MSGSATVSNSTAPHRDENLGRGLAPTVSVVICAYTLDRWDDLLGAVASVRRQRFAACETIVVIDHNLELLQRARGQLDDTAVIANNGPNGLSGARNTGVAAARGEVVAFLDDDARAAEGWLESLVEAYEDHSAIGAGGHVAPRWKGEPPAWLPEEFYWTVGCSYRGLPSVRGPIRNPIGANMSFRRAVLADVGGFTEGIGRVGARPLGCEETELSIRARRAHPGRAVLHVPSAVVEHSIAAERVSWRYFCRRCWSEGLSKAHVTRHVGPEDALSSEWRYTLRTLPTGVLRGLGDAARGELSGLSRAGSILLGLILTAAGYAWGSAR